MLGNPSSYGHVRNYPTFLLPTFPSIFRSWKAPSPPASSQRDSVISNETTGSSSSSSSNGRGDHCQRSSYRDSVDSATSSLSSTSSTSNTSESPALASTPPSSYGSTFARSLSACPIGLRASHPSFATSLTAEPEQAAACSATPPPPYAEFVAQWERHGGIESPPRRRLIRSMPETLRCSRCSTDFAFRAQIVSKGFTGRHGRAYLVSAPSTSPNHLFAPEVPATSGHDHETKQNDLINIRVGQPEHRQLVTGAHVVADIFCKTCSTKVGWKYVDARDAAQKYKVGKFILEMARIATYHSWEDADEDLLARDHYCRPALSGQRGDDEDDAVFPWYDSDLAPGNAVTDTVGAVRELSVGNKHVNHRMCAPPDDVIEFDSDDEDECDEIFAGTWDAQVVANRRMLKQYASMASK